MRLIFILLVLMAFGCKNDKAVVVPVVANDLMGNWEVFFVSRNGKMTKTTENAYITFSDDKTIKSNLFSEEKNHTFTFVDNKVKVKGEPLLKDFVVKDLLNDTLILTSKIQSFKMEFSLVKK